MMMGSKGLVGIADIEFVHKKHLGKQAMTEEEFENYVKEAFDHEAEIFNGTIGNVTNLTLNGYNGYYMEFRPTSDYYMDSTLLYVHIDGYAYTFHISYDLDDIDPAIKEAGIQSALEVIGSIRPKE